MLEIPLPSDSAPLSEEVMFSPLMARWRHIHEEIARSCLECSRPLKDVHLIAVSKQVAWEDIWPLLKAGQRCFGENRVQEAQAKWPLLRLKAQEAGLEGPPIELHLIGPLQSNKVRDAVHLFDVIQTIDRWKIAEVLAREMKRAGKSPRLYLQVNTGEEPQKAGIPPKDLPALLEACRKEGLKIDGLMCIPPVENHVSPHFALLKKMAQRENLSHLSMGMSQDYTLAIPLGATHIRVGTALFGQRLSP